MARVPGDIPKGGKSHTLASALTVEDRSVEPMARALKERARDVQEPQGRALDKVDRGTAWLFQGSGGQMSSPASPATPRGQALGRYLLLGELGSGGMGTVFKAYDESLERAVAIKLLSAEAAERHAERLRREAQALAKLSHPNVVQVYEVGQHDGQWFIAMELIHGQTLRTWQETPRGWRKCVEIYLQAGAGLVAAHAKGFIHRDFKPDNCIVDRAGRPRVLDFGLVGAAEPVLDVISGEIEAIGRGERDLDAPLTESGTVLGTPAYMPPEQMRGEGADARSDQFSFCVSLYEAVYGERPFDGDTMSALLEAVSLGTMRTTPKGMKVPGSLRQILVRGLASNPLHRWSSMEEMLAELQRLVAPNRGRWLALSATVALGLGLFGIGQAYQADVGQRCTGARAQLEGIWDDDRRQQVRDAILGTELSFASDTWDRVEPGLDTYARDWTDTHTEACEATSVRGEQTPEEMSLRMRCLDQRRTALRATVGQLTDANAETNARVVENAVKLVVGLPTLARCNDLAWLEQQDQLVPPPENPKAAGAVEAQRARLVEIEAMQKAGRYAEALEEAEEVVERAERLGYPPFRAEALYWRGALREDNGQYAKAEEDLQQAYALAVSHQHDPVALDTAQALVFVVGVQLARHVEGQQWGEMNALPLAQRSGEPFQESLSLSNLGLVFNSQGDYGNARVYHQRALAIFEDTLGSDHPNVADSLSNLGIVFSHQGDYENARMHFEQALAIQERALGPDHPNVADSLNNLGLVFFRKGDDEEALVHHQRALAIREKAPGPSHPSVANSLNNLGLVFKSSGDNESARRHFEQALAILENALGSDHPLLANSLNNLGNIFDNQGDYEDAKLHHQRALTIRERALGPNHPNVADSLNNLGNVFSSLGDNESARHHFERALAIQERALGLDHPYVAYPLFGLAEVALKANNSVSAQAHAERAVSIREAATVTPTLLAEARFVLARALWSKHSERSRARALAEQARRAYAEHGKGREDDLAEVNAWLTTHDFE
ncbi:MAG: tetratricopeptide repeat protein [Myxococcota bacterium]